MWARLFCVVFLVLNSRAAFADFDDFLKPLLAKRCVKCHGGQETNGEVNLKQLAAKKHLLARPKLLKKMVEALEGGDMPPEDEPQLEDKTRTKLVVELKSLLRTATAGKPAVRTQIRRLNRFQYNYTVKDLFQLKTNVFKLPEKLMTRHDNYLRANPRKMPSEVRVASQSLNPQGGLRNVRAFPKDLRAAHGYDNQANKLTLSPLLFDAFLRLSVSIVESPDFNEKNVGLWDAFFKQPADKVDTAAEVRKRLATFLQRAFRRPVEEETVNRYTAYVVSKIKNGMSFTDAMKKVASATLSSPMFLFRTPARDATGRQFELASNLSFFLWSSGPDEELLRLAAAKKLTDPKTLQKTIDRMLADPRIERFLDSFPAQWMQLENILAATPDPRRNRYYSLDKNYPAGLQMVLEPLLLFDSVFVENRSILDLISPGFTYQSEFLKTWYHSQLKPPPVDVAAIENRNRINDSKCRALEAKIKTADTELSAMLKSVRSKLLEAKKKSGAAKKPIDLKPYAAWEFNGNLKDSAGAFDLTAHGKIRFENGMVVLNRAYLLSKKLPVDLRAKSLEVWCKVPNLNQRGGGVIGIQGPGDFFDTIVLGERKPRHWISGSNGHRRTLDFPDSKSETKANQMLHLVMVYQRDGTTRLYRDGKPYGRPYRRGAATFPKDRTSVIFGLRHLPAGGNKYLTVSIDKARIYRRALTADEVAASFSGNSLYVSEEEIAKALTPKQRQRRDALSHTLAKLNGELKRVPARQDPKRLQQTAQKRFDDDLRRQMRRQVFRRTKITNPRYGGVITNAAMLTMTSGPKRTHPIARGAWIIEVIFNDPPPPPPNDVPALNEDGGDRNLTIREKFAKHRENKTCAACHSRLDPLGFALENFDITGRWRDKYENGRDVDSSGTLVRKHKFAGVVAFKTALVKEQQRFARAFAAHLLRYATARELSPADVLKLDEIIAATGKADFKLQAIIREVIRKAYIAR